MVGRKPIASARQIKTRVQFMLRATESDVALNSEKSRLMDMIESMKEAGVLQEFLLDALKSKLRQEEGQSVVASTIVEVGPQARPQRTAEPQTPYQSEPHQAPVVAKVVVPESREPVVVFEAMNPAPTAQAQVIAEVGAVRNQEAPRAIIGNVIREIEADGKGVDSSDKAPLPTQVRSRPRGNLLGAMG